MLRRAFAVTLGMAMGVTISSSQAAAVSRPHVFRLDIPGYNAAYPDQLFEIRYQGPPSNPGRLHVIQCPSRCAFAFGPGTGVPPQLRFTVLDNSSSNALIKAYEQKVGLPYQVLSYHGCKAAFLSDPLQSSCAGMTSRSITVRIALRYRPLMRVALFGDVEAGDSAFLDFAANSATDPYGSPGQTSSAGCVIYVGSVQGECAGHVNPGTVNVSVTGNQAPNWQFDGFDGPCAGQGGPFTPTSDPHRCTFAISNDLTLTATTSSTFCMCTTTKWGFTPPPFTEPPKPKRQITFGPPGRLIDAADEIFNELFSSPLVKLGVLSEVLFLKEAGSSNPGTVDVKGVATGRGARDAAATPLFSWHLPAGTLEPIALPLTTAGDRFFKSHSSARVAVSVTYTAAGRATTVSRTGLLRR